jgi:hypothetical protein
MYSGAIISGLPTVKVLKLEIISNYFEFPKSHNLMV